MVRFRVSVNRPAMRDRCESIVNRTGSPPLLVFWLILGVDGRISLVLLWLYLFLWLAGLEEAKVDVRSMVVT
jgi:hypothetical protein